MKSSVIKQHSKPLIYFVFISAALFLANEPVWSDPPPWAPAHGYRNKHKNKHKHYDEYDYGYAEELGILNGRCIYEKVGTILGGVVGGVLGSKVGDGSGRKIAVIAGTIIGAVVGNRVGKYYDQKDRYCTGQALEHAQNGQRITWNNPDTGLTYKVTPIKSYYRDTALCREFIVESTALDGNTSKKRNDACRGADKVWETLY